MTMTMTMRGHKDLNRMLTQLGPETFKKDLPKATRKAVAPTRKAIRDLIRPHDRTGQLRKSIGRSGKKYKSSGVVFESVGPRRGFEVQHEYEFLGRKFSQTASPPMYSHLLDQGTNPHHQKKLGFDHPGTEGINFMRRGWTATVNKQEQIMTTELGKLIPRRAFRLGGGRRSR